MLSAAPRSAVSNGQCVTGRVYMTITSSLFFLHRRPSYTPAASAGRTLYRCIPRLLSLYQSSQCWSGGPFILLTCFSPAFPSRPSSGTHWALTTENGVNESDMQHHVVSQSTLSSWSGARRGNGSHTLFREP